MWPVSCKVETYVLRFWETQFPQLKTQQKRNRPAALSASRRRAGLEDQAPGHTGGLYARWRTPSPGAKPSPTRPQPDPQPDPQSRLPLAVVGQSQQSRPRTEDVASTIAHARTELREIANMLAAPEPQPPRRRARLATMPVHVRLALPAFLI